MANAPQRFYVHRDALSPPHSCQVQPVRRSHIASPTSIPAPAHALPPAPAPAPGANVTTPGTDATVTGLASAVVTDNIKDDEKDASGAISLSLNSDSKSLSSTGPSDARPDGTIQRDQVMFANLAGPYGACYDADQQEGGAKGTQANSGGEGESAGLAADPTCSENGREEEEAVPEDPPKQFKILKRKPNGTQRGKLVQSNQSRPARSRPFSTVTPSTEKSSLAAAEKTSIATSSEKANETNLEIPSNDNQANTLDSADEKEIASTVSTNGDAQTGEKSLEERERDYAMARARIFSYEETVDEEGAVALAGLSQSAESENTSYSRGSSRGDHELYSPSPSQRHSYHHQGQGWRGEPGYRNSYHQNQGNYRKKSPTPPLQGIAVTTRFE